MCTTTFDTLKFVKNLKTAGISQKQAEAFSEAFAEAQKDHQQNLATKADLKELELKINGQLLLLKWMIGFILAGVASLILKEFFAS